MLIVKKLNGLFVIDSVHYFFLVKSITNYNTAGKRYEVRQKNTPKIKFGMLLSNDVMDILSKNRIEIMGRTKIVS